MTPISTQAFVDLIATRLGLRVRRQEEVALGDKLLQRVQILGLSSLEAYYHILATSFNSVVEDREWLKLIEDLTVNESYFFRDQGQFSLLRNRLLPELIQAKQQTRIAQDKAIRVWSAGCSTGEEAYSLAILLQELIPSEPGWTVLVLGTDISEAALAQAKEGIYGDWSFRSLNPEIKKKYFRPHHQGWQVVPEVQNMVTFQLGNLVQDGHSYLLSKLHHLDLILCRNVFIYFNPTSIATALDRFAQALAPNGYLMTGHMELHGQDLSQFQVKPFPESVVYQRLPAYGQPATLPQMPSVDTPSPSFSLKTPPQPVRALPIYQGAVLEQPPSQVISLGEVLRLMHNKAYTEAISVVRQLIAQSPCCQAYYLMAETYANLGDHPNALQACQQALQLDPFAIEPIFLLAQISQEQGNLSEARHLLRRVIYLAPTSVYAYFELGCLYEQEGNMEKACKNWRSTVAGLRQMRPETTVDFHRCLTAAELQVMVAQKLNLNQN